MAENLLGELLWVHVGQCGVQLAEQLWGLFREDHQVDERRAVLCEPPTAAFMIRGDGDCTPRNLFIDTDPAPIWYLKTNHKIIPSEKHVANEMESSASIYPRGMLSSAAGVARERVRNILEKTDHPSGVVFIYGSGGGTGSGLTTHVSARLFSENPKLKQVHFVVSPSPAIRSLPTSSVEPYNVGLMAHDMSNLANCSLLIDNDALYHVCGQKAKINRPDYSFINEIISMAVLVTTSAWRFSSCPSIKFDDMPTNLVISPKMKFSVMSLAPVFKEGYFDYEMMTTGDLTRELFQVNSYLTRCDPRAGTMAACIAYRGQGISAVRVSEALVGLLQSKGANFASWAKPSFKVGITDAPLPCLLGMKLPRSACMLSNTCGLAPLWGQLDWAFRTMYSKRAFLHWYMREGTEMDDFVETSETLRNILQLYMEN